MWQLVALLALITIIVGGVHLRRIANERFRESEKRYRDLVDTLPHFVYSVDNADRYVAVNRAVCAFFHRPAREIIGKTALELGIPAEIAREWTAQNAAVRSVGETQTIDHATPIDGQVRQIRNIISPMRNERGEIVRVTGIAIDVTGQRAAEAGVQRLLRALEQIDEVIFMTDVEGKITYVNPAFEKIYGYSREEAVGQTPRLLKSGELPPSYYEKLWSELLSGRSVRVEYRNRRKDGSLVDVINTVSPVFEEDRITGFIAGQQDVTARNRAAEEHRQLDERIARMAKMEALGTLAGGIAHDFNNILSVVLSHADLLERINEGLPRAARPIATIKQAVRRGAVLSRHILTFARRTEVDLAEVNVATLIDELAGMLAETFPRTVKVSVDLDSGLPRVMADAGQLHQALLNLSINARDAMPNGGTLRIAAHSVSPSDMKRILADSDAPEGVCIEVADEGIGMDEETQRRMFEPFFTTKEPGKGTGLGLALVYGVVKGHHGFVDVESRPGAGTRFFIYLPRGKNAAPSDRKESLPDAASGTESLLLIEDEAALCEALSIELCRHGYQVVTAENGVRAIELFNDTTRSIDLVVTDLGMPEMSAVDLIAALRAIMPRVPIIGMTGYLGPEFHAAVLAAGAECIVQKPFGIDELLRAIREVLDRRQ